MKCEACDGTGQIDHCANCVQKIGPRDARIMLSDKVIDGASRWFGPFCALCIGIDVEAFRNEQLKRLSDAAGIRHSRDQTEVHDMTELLGDLRTRPTEPPGPDGK